MKFKFAYPLLLHVEGKWQIQESTLGFLINVPGTFINLQIFVMGVWPYLEGVRLLDLR